MLGRSHKLFARVAGSVFSVEHPIATAYGNYEWHRDDAGAKLHWKVDRYREEGPRKSEWFVPGVIKYHRTVETYVNFCWSRA